MFPLESRKMSILGESDSMMKVSEIITEAPAEVSVPESTKFPSEIRHAVYLTEFILTEVALPFLERINPCIVLGLVG